MYGYVFRNVILREKKSQTKLTANVLKQDQATLKVKRQRQSDAVVFLCLANNTYFPCLPTVVFPASIYRGVSCVCLPSYSCVYIPWCFLRLLTVVFLRLYTVVFPASIYRRIPASIYRGVSCVYLPSYSYVYIPWCFLRLLTTVFLRLYTVMFPVSTYRNISCVK